MTLALGEDKPRRDSMVFSAEYSWKNPTTIFKITTAVTTPPSMNDFIPKDTPNARRSTNIIALTICFNRILGHPTPSPPSNYSLASRTIRGLDCRGTKGNYSVGSICSLSLFHFRLVESVIEIGSKLLRDIVDGEQVRRD